MNEQPIFNVNKITDEMFGTMAKRRAEEASTHWNSTHKLSSIRKDNNKFYTGGYIEEQLIDERYEEVFADNRLFTSVRTVLPFLTGRITAPEVVPANGDDESISFARDFEQALQRHAEKQQGRAKIRLSVQDVLRGERIGYLKWRYAAELDDIVLDHVPADSVIIGKRSKLFEEPDFLRHTQERSVGDLLRCFPDKEKSILDLFGIQKGVPSQLERLHKVDEDWIWAEIDGKKVLLVGWSYRNTVFGKMTDPNWNEDGNNMLQRSMIPFVMFNFLNDGSGWIDQTSFIEQSKWLQKNVNKRGQVIAESAKYGGTGVPIFAKGSITQKDVAKIKFSPIQRVLLDSADVNKSFTTWQAQNMPEYIIKDKEDQMLSIDNIWGTPDVLRGEQTDSRTMGQDLLVRDQAEGRQADPIDCIDDAMTRFYLLEAQLMYRYYDEDHFYNYIGNDGKFVSIVVSQKQIAKNLGIEINVQAGTSLPVDRAQKRATIMELLKSNKVSLLLAYKELGIFDDPEEAFRQFVKEQVLPFAAMDDAKKTTESREAEQDLQAVIAGKKPIVRDDTEKEYLDHLNNYLMSNKFHLLNGSQQKRVSQFVQDILGQAQLKMAKMQGQDDSQPPPPKAKPVMNYRDLPPDIQAQMEQSQGFQPSPIHQEQAAAGVAHTGTNTTTVIPPDGQQPTNDLGGFAAAPPGMGAPGQQMPMPPLPNPQQPPIMHP